MIETPEFHESDARHAGLVAPPRDPAVEIAELAAALEERPRRIPSKYFYDAEGSRLFERICELPEYYPTRTELAILREHVDEIAARLGPDVVLVEYGSGTSLKTGLLLSALDRPRAYVPVDVSVEPLLAAADRLTDEFPTLHVEPVCADFTHAFELAPSVPSGRRRIAYFPGSTIGNFANDDAVALLAAMRELVGGDGAAVVGVDLRKDPAILRRAYDDAAGVTAAFNLNLLRHVDAEFGLGLDPRAFRHEAPWVEAAGRIEMRLVASRPQVARLAPGPDANTSYEYPIAAGDYLLTEYSHKYRLAEFAALAARAGWRTARVWTDEREWFSVQLLEPAASPSAQVRS